MVNELQGMNVSRESPAKSYNGYVMLLVLLATVAWFAWTVSGGAPDSGASKGAKLLFVGSLLGAGIPFLLILCGFFMIQPNQTAVITLFGAYSGTERTEGLRWVWPWMMRKKISARAHNVHSEKVKINDLRGNPIEIACNVVWRVRDTAQAAFDVDDYKQFVEIQIEAGLRTVGARHPYDDMSDEDETTLRGSAEVVNRELCEELNERLRVAGIVVEDALAKLSADGIVDLDDERKAAMVSNLMIVLCGDREAQPVVNTGTLYQ